MPRKKRGIFKWNNTCWGLKNISETVANKDHLFLDFLLKIPPFVSHITGQSGFPRIEKHDTNVKPECEQFCWASRADVCSWTGGGANAPHDVTAHSPLSLQRLDGKSDTAVWTAARRDWRNRRDGAYAVEKDHQQRIPSWADVIPPAHAQH